VIRFQLANIDRIGQEVTARAEKYQTAAKALIEEYADATVDLTRQLVPVETGFMRDHVDKVISEDGLGFTVGWFESDFEAIGKPNYAIVIEFGAVSKPAQPSLGPAWNDLEPSFLKDVRELGSIFSGR
jgi:hypothetical protein